MVAHALPYGANSCVEPEEATAPLPLVSELDLKQDIVVYFLIYIALLPTRPSPSPPCMLAALATTPSCSLRQKNFTPPTLFPLHTFPFQNAAETNAGPIRKKRVLWCNCLSTLLGNISFGQLIKYIPGPIQRLVTRTIAATANAGKRPQVTESRRKKAGFGGKRLPRAPAAQRQPPAPRRILQRVREPQEEPGHGQAESAEGGRAFSPLTPLSFHLFVLYSNGSICTRSDTP